MTYEILEPMDWDRAGDLAETLVKDAAHWLRTIHDRPAWQDIPDEVRTRLQAHLPREGADLEQVIQDLWRDVMSYPMGNLHPRFWAWYMGGSNFTGALADFMAAIIGSNLGGGNHAASLVDMQVVDWLREMMGFPEGASGTLVSGGSVANLVALTVARNEKAGIDLREEGLGALTKPMRFYTSDQAHSCHQKSIETLGLGNKSLRRVPSKSDLTMDVAQLAQMVAEDRAAGFNPAAVIATAGTVNTGAIDDLEAIVAFARKENMWFHVDGCIRAFLAIAPENRHRVAGIEQADSLALDPHKWMHAPFEVGCTLIRNPDAHLRTFSLSPEYLQQKPRGVARHFLFDFGLQTSRGFRALKVWMSLKEHGVGKFGKLVDDDIAKATYLTDLIRRTDNLDLLFATNINITCFRFDPGGLDEARLKEVNTEIVMRLQEEGIAVLSDTTVHGQHCLRVAINNYRTAHEDLDLLVQEVLRLGRELTADM